MSRLNRVAKRKTDTLVLDFVNEPEQIQEAFQQYYQTTTLANETDPNKKLSQPEINADLKRQLYQVYLEQPPTVS